MAVIPDLLIELGLDPAAVLREAILTETALGGAENRIPTSTSLTDIAGSLGYAESSAFSRAFQRWSGASPFERRSMATQI
jgi:AraC-like DNA-binding protein